MTVFWLAICLFIIVALLVVWKIFTFSSNTLGASNTAIRQETNISLYHEHLNQLETDLSEGAIEQESYQQLKQELDKTLIQDVDLNVEQETQHTNSTIRWPIFIGISIVAFSLFTYMQLGAYTQISTANLSSTNPDQALSPQQRLLSRIQQLETQVNKEPENAGARFNLAQAYISGGEFRKAISALDTVIEQVGEHAEILGIKAQAMYYLNKQHIDKSIQQVIDKSLNLDELDPSTNILIGMDHFKQGDFAKAVSYWQKVVNSGRLGVNVPALSEAIVEAKNQLRIRQEMTGNTTETNVQTNNKKPIVNQTEIAINLSLAEHVKQVLSTAGEKTVFIYAIATKGPRMPLAAVKINSSDLPKRIILNDSQAMTSELTLSRYRHVNIFAVVSMQGSAGVKSGDFKAEKLNINLNTDNELTMKISQQVQ